MNSIKLTYEIIGLAIVIAGICISARGLKRAMASRRFIHSNPDPDAKQQSLIAGAARRNFRDEANLLMVQVVFLGSGILRLMNDVTEVQAGFVYEILGVIRLLASFQITLRCLMDIADLQRETLFYDTIKMDKP